MRKCDEKLSPEAELLNHYLDQYRYCIRIKNSLEHRRNEIIREFDSPLSAVNYDGMPRASGEGLGSAALSFRLDEIDSRIKEQMGKATKALADIMDIIDFLPMNSMERIIIERKYIDRCSWGKICKTEHMSRTPATRHWRKGLYALLEFKRVQQIMNDYKQELEQEA